MVKTILKWTILVVLVAYVVVAAAWARSEAHKSVCTGIEVKVAENDATDSVSAPGVLSEIRKFKGELVGQPLHSINTKEIEHHLMSMPQFESVDCSATTLGKLNISVVPMIPVARVFDNGKSYYINREGKEMESKANFFVEMPVISGNFTADFRPEEVLPTVNYVSRDPVLSQLVSMVHAKGKNDIYLVPRIQGHIINFGDTLRLDEKKEALITFYRKVMPYKGWNTYDTISVKFRGQVVATRKDKSRVDHGGNFIEETDMEEATLPEV